MVTLMLEAMGYRLPAASGLRDPDGSEAGPARVARTVRLAVVPVLRERRSRRLRLAPDTLVRVAMSAPAVV
jgi:hypothetical protein